MTTADPKDRLETLIDEFFRAVSFQAGEIPAYGRIRELFVEGGKLIKNSSETPEISKGVGDSSLPGNAQGWQHRWQRGNSDDVATRGDPSTDVWLRRVTDGELDSV